MSALSCLSVAGIPPREMLPNAPPCHCPDSPTASCVPNQMFKEAAMSLQALEMQVTMVLGCGMCQAARKRYGARVRAVSGEGAGDERGVARARGEAVAAR